MVYGYARVSTEDQKLHLQLDALKQTGCTKIFKEKVSAAKERPELEKLIVLLKKDDTIVTMLSVWDFFTPIILHPSEHSNLSGVCALSRWYAKA